MKWAIMCFNTECFSVKVAENIFQKSHGLAGVSELKRNEGMFFVFQMEWRRSFWMKGTLIPLDIVWLNKNMEVVEITKDQQPCRKIFCRPIRPKVKSKYVLEINAGLAEKTGIRVGDTANIDFQS